MTKLFQLFKKFADTNESTLPQLLIFHHGGLMYFSQEISISRPGALESFYRFKINTNSLNLLRKDDSALLP